MKNKFIFRFFSFLFTKAGRGTAWNKFPLNLSNLEFFACTGRTAENLPILLQELSRQIK
jgi:hypothetical protein